MTAPRRLNLAIQGGGSHGAFAWGVVDAFLADDRFDIAAITATSAGAMVAVVVADGMRKGGREGGRKALEEFWRRISESRSPGSPVSNNRLRELFDPFNLFKDVRFKLFELVSSMASPYQFNPANWNPLRETLAAMVDFEALKAASPIQLFIATTQVKSGTPRVFRETETSIDVVLAAACLPYLFQAVHVDGEPLWDGGYVANPALWPVFYEPQLPDDVLICCINPLERADLPKTPVAIMDRLNEINFNTALLAELRAINFVNKLLDDRDTGPVLQDRYRSARIHAIFADEALGGLGVESKFDTSWPFLTSLRDKGRAAFKAWADAHGEAVGYRCSVDIEKDFLGL